LLAVALYVVWFVGILFEFEYPYVFTLMGVRNAVSATGVPVSKIINSYEPYKDRHLHWHTCSYEDQWCGNHPDLVAVELRSEDGGQSETLELFAYSRRTHILVPMTGKTAGDFPSLMPPGDELANVRALNGLPGTQNIGIGNFKLPAKWFRTIIQAETNAKQKALSTN
ncbi:MAG: hypothetical protein JWQ04_788, partial [Pedosphaera sp.]|nr:hypothetical protein [Pedosphaera sp.]